MRRIIKISQVLLQFSIKSCIKLTTKSVNMVRVVSQETYDEVVKENIDEFDMSPEEAVKEAVAQFEAQGVDLSNIIKDLALGDGDDHLVTKTVITLKELLSNSYDYDEVLKELEVLKTECNKDLARRMRAGKDGAYNVLIDLLEISSLDYYSNETNKKVGEFIVKVLNTLVALMDTQPDLLDDKGVNCIKSLLDGIKNEDVLIATLQWTGICCIKHEANRKKLFSKGIGDTLKPFINTKNAQLLRESLQAIRKFTLDDDVRVEFGNAGEHARVLGYKLLEPLTKLLKENTKPPMVADLMLTMATLLVRHELCKMVADSGSDVLFNILADNYDNVAVIQQANKLITALAGNDDVKRELVKSGIVPIVVSLLSRHSGNATSSALTLKSVAALTLREPDHSMQFLENGAPEAVVECMKIHKDNASVQKHACWAIRNLVGRCREHNSKFHELGVESLLNAAFAQFEAEFGFDIKSALRDLECEVKLDEQWTGKGVKMDL